MEKIEEIKIKTTRINAGNRRQKGRRSAPKVEDRRATKSRDGEYAYTFEDANLGKLQVLNTENAWWKDKDKLTKLIDAYKFYATDDQACFYAGITIDQLKYFQQLHPQLYTIKHLAKQDPGLRAKRTIVKSLETDKETAKWWTERTEKEFNPKVEQTGTGRDLYDGLTKEIKELGEQLRNSNYDKPSDTTEEHSSGEDTGGTSTGPDGNTNDASPTETTDGGQDISKQAS